MMVEDEPVDGGPDFKLGSINSRFSGHILDERGISHMREIRKAVRAVAVIIDQICPPGEEKEFALSELQIVMMMANNSIAQKYPIDMNEFPGVTQ